MGLPTVLSQASVDEIGGGAEERAQVEPFVVRRRHPIIDDVRVVVETRPGVDVVGPVGGVQHVGHAQRPQQVFILGGSAENRQKQKII